MEIKGKLILILLLSLSLAQNRSLSEDSEDGSVPAGFISSKVLNSRDANYS